MTTEGVALPSTDDAVVLSQGLGEEPATPPPPPSFRCDSIIIPVAAAQLRLQQLAGRGMRQLVHHHDGIRQPPLRHLSLIDPQHGLGIDRMAGPRHHQQQRPLVPFRVLVPR